MSDDIHALEAERLAPARLMMAGHYPNRRKIMSSKDLPRDTDGKLSMFAWPGGYPIFYVDSECDVLCPTCADNEEPDSVQGADVNYEDGDLHCAECGNRVPSAYAEDGA